MDPAFLGFTRSPSVFTRIPTGLQPRCTTLLQDKVSGNQEIHHLSEMNKSSKAINAGFISRGASIYRVGGQPVSYSAVSPLSFSPFLSRKRLLYFMKI